MDKTGEDWIATSLRPDPSVRSGRERALGQAHVGILCNKPSRIEPKTPSGEKRPNAPLFFRQDSTFFQVPASCSLLDKIRERNRAAASWRSIVLRRRAKRHAGLGPKCRAGHRQL